MQQTKARGSLVQFGPNEVTVNVIFKGDPPLICHLCRESVPVADDLACQRRQANGPVVQGHAFIQVHKNLCLLQRL